MANTFSVTYDRTTKVVSALAVVTLLSIVLVTHSGAVGPLATLIVFLSYGYSPCGYTLSNRALTVKRLIGNVHIGLDHLQEVRTAGAGDLKWAVRLWGSGGLFGYYGLYRTAGLGKCTWYVTDRGKCVVLITGEKTAVLSPNDVEGFIAAIRAADYTQKIADRRDE